MYILKSIFLFLTLLTLTQCASNSTETKAPSCKLSDTLIKKVTYKMSKQDFTKFTAIEENKYIEVNQHKLWIKYSPIFYTDKLFSLSVTFDTSNVVEEIKVYKSIEDFALNHKFKAPSNNPDYLNCSLHEKLLEIYMTKYGTPTTKEISGKKGSWQTREMGSFFIEYMDFDIHNKYEWKCSDKYIKIEFDIHAILNADLAKANKSETEILEAKSYQVYNYNAFEVLYENLQLKTEYEQAIGKKFRLK